MSVNPNHAAALLIAALVSVLAGCDVFEDGAESKNGGGKLDLGEKVNLVWAAEDGWDREIFLLHENRVKRLTENDYEDYAPDIHDNVVVWAAEEDTSVDSATIYYYDMVSVRKIARVYALLGGPVTSKGRVAWSGNDGDNWGIFLWQNGSITRISDRGHDDYQPVMSGDTVAWTGYNGSKIIPYFWDGKAMGMNGGAGDIPSSFAYDRGKMAWVSAAQQVVWWDGRTEIKPVANSEYTQWHPDIDSGMVVWDSDSKIWMRRNDSVIQISATEYGDSWPRVHRGKVTWMRVSEAGFNQIVYWDGVRERQLTFEAGHHTFPVIWVAE